MSRAEDSLRQPNFDWTTSARNAFGSFASSVPAALLGRETTWTEIPYEQLEFGDLIGAGSFGTVHAGRLFGSEVAIKRFQLVTAASAPVLVASMCRSRARGQRARRNGRLEERAQRVGARRAAELALL